MYSYLFFDLDGTLADSQAGILDSFRHAFTAMGTDLPPIEVLKTYIGPPLENAMSLYWPEEEACHQALKHFRTYYRQEGVYHCQRFTGVTDLLAALKAAGCQLYLTTSKNQAMAEEMSRYLEIDQYFSGIFGGLPDANNKTKVLTRALEFSGAAKAQAAIIGDTHFDMTGGKNCSIACLGVLWGYGTAQELSQAGADQLFEGPQDLLNYLTL